MEISNSKIAKLLRDVAAAYVIKGEGNIFQIRAYENAADSIEHSTAEIQDLWEEGKLRNISGLGPSIQSYLNELFTKGSISHFDNVKKGIPEVVFDLLEISGVGPKTAQKIADLGVKNLKDLEIKLKSGSLVEKGFSSTVAQKILLGLTELNARGNRMLLPYALVQADKILDYLKKGQNILKAHSLGSLRRKVATIGDLDFSVASDNPESVINYFCEMPGIARILDKGENKATVILTSGIQVDLLVSNKDSYGALLQHFTGSKNHNISLRTLANKKGLSLSEYGVKEIKTEKTIKTETEEEFYKLLGMETMPPEIRENTGEIEAALKHKLPKLVEPKDIKGDLHLHSNFPIKSPSHGPGVNSIEEIVEKAKELNYEFVGISDHPLGFSNNTKQEAIDWVIKRTKFIQNLKSKTKSIRVLNGLEIDILGDGSLSVPDKALATLDYCIAGIHSGHRSPKEVITKRLLVALNSPYVDIISHPTNRLLNERDSSDADWVEVFKLAAKNNKLLEINAFVNRLDLRDDLVRMALDYGVKFIINTDAHQLKQMDNMEFGVDVARRGWVTAESVVNTWGWTAFAKWFKL